jgi:hypothetical protein
MSSDEFENIRMYPNGVKRIAVCLYGCYRTGDYVLPWLKKLLTDTQIQVDYFCSIRNFDQYRTSAIDVEKIHRTDDELIEKLSVLNPVSIDILDYDTTTMFNQGHATEKSMADAIMLKQAHEASAGIEYDIVLLARYDTLPEPMPNLARRLARIGDTMTYKQRYVDLITNARGSWICTYRQQHGLHHSPWASSVHDYFVYGSSVAMDLIALEFLKLAGSPTYTVVGKEKRVSGTGMRHIHMTLAAVISQMDINIMNLPFISSVIVRPYADLSLDPTVHDDYEKLKSAFNNEPKIMDYLKEAGDK